MAQTLRRHSRLFGIPIDAVTMEEVLADVQAAIQRRCRLLIGVVNAAKIVHMSRDGCLRFSVLGADLILPDGMGVVWAARWLGQPLPERVTGIDLMTQILEAGNHKGYRIFFLGATPEVLKSTVGRVKTEYPGVVVAGEHHGYFEAGTEFQLVQQIRASRADVLLVAMSSPKKEEFLARWADALGVPVLHGVGGAFDVFSGKVKRAPVLWQRLGLEWLYRVVQEPRRMWKRYLTTNVLFARLVWNEWRVRRRGAVPGECRTEWGMP